MITPGTDTANPASVPSNVRRALSGAYPCCSPVFGSGAVSPAISGTNAPFVTRYSFWNTRTKNASGNSNSPWMCIAISGHSAACPTAATTHIARRAPRLLSISGPSNGDTMANGASVNSRYSSTWWSAAFGEMEKNNDPANEIVTSVPPPSIAHCSNDSRPIGCVWSNRSRRACRAMSLNCSTLADIATEPMYGVP